MRSICASWQFGPACPYHHFVNRDALLATIAEEGFSVLEMAMIRERDAVPDDATSRLAALGRAYVNFATAHRGHFRVMFRRDLERRISSGSRSKAQRARTRKTLQR